MNERATLLPYRSELGMILGRNIAELRRHSNLGQVRIEDGQLRLVGVDGIMAACPIREVSVSRVRMWFGNGVRLDLGAGGKWYVKPPLLPLRLQAARRDTRVL